MTLGTRLKAQVALPKGAIPDAKLNIFKVVTQVIGSARWLQRSQMISSVVLVHCRKKFGLSKQPSFFYRLVKPSSEADAFSLDHFGFICKLISSISCSDRKQLFPFKSSLDESAVFYS